MTACIYASEERRELLSVVVDVFDKSGQTFRVLTEKLPFHSSGYLSILSSSWAYSPPIFLWNLYNGLYAALVRPHCQCAHMKKQCCFLPSEWWYSLCLLELTNKQNLFPVENCQIWNLVLSHIGMKIKKFRFCYETNQIICSKLIESFHFNKVRLFWFNFALMVKLLHVTKLKSQSELFWDYLTKMFWGFTTKNIHEIGAFLCSIFRAIKSAFFKTNFCQNFFLPVPVLIFFLMAKDWCFSISEAAVLLCLHNAAYAAGLSFRSLALECQCLGIREENPARIFCLI